MSIEQYLKRARKLGKSNNTTEWAEAMIAIVNAVYLLPNRIDRIVLLDYYGNMKTARAIGEALGISPEQIYRIKTNAIQQLKKVFAHGKITTA